MDTAFLQFLGILWGTMILGFVLWALLTALYFAIHRRGLRATSEYSDILQAFATARQDITDLRLELSNTEHRLTIELTKRQDAPTQKVVASMPEE